MPTSGINAILFEKRKLMRILSVGGTNFHHQRYVELLAKAGVEVHWIKDGAFNQKLDLPVKTCQRWPLSGRRTVSRVIGSAFGNQFADWVIHLQLRSAWCRTQAQLCHVNWIDERAYHCAMAGLRPLVLTALGSDLNTTKLPDHDPKLLEQKAYAIAQCDLFIADSDDMIALASELAGRKLRSILLPIGIDTEMFRPGYKDEATQLRSALGIPEGALIILSPRVIGRLYRQDLIMKAFCRALREGKVDAYIIFKKYGVDEFYLDEVLAIASQQGFLERVRIIEKMSYNDLPILYSMATFAVNFPSMDAFPVTFLECCACELPILSNELPAYFSNGMSEYITFVDGEDEHALSRHLVSMCNSVVDRPQLSRARTHVVRYFDESIFIDELVSAYSRLVTQSCQPNNHARKHISANP